MGPRGPGLPRKRLSPRGPQVTVALHFHARESSAWALGPGGSAEAQDRLLGLRRLSVCPALLRHALWNQAGSQQGAVRGLTPVTAGQLDQAAGWASGWTPQAPPTKGPQHLPSVHAHMAVPTGLALKKAWC